MAVNHSVMQWNIRGVSANYQELQLLSSQLKPSVIALQETLQRENKNISISNFHSILEPAQPSDRGGVTGGVGLLIHKSVLYSQLK